jgi:hypothetical protein
LGALAKSIAAFIPVVGVLVFIAITRRVTTVFAAWPRYLAAGLAALGPLVAFYIARERAGPGYVEAVVFNDLVGRYRETMILEPSGPTFYLEHLAKGWFFAGPLLLALPLGLRGLGRRERLLSLYAASVVLVALAIYSSAANRAMQYALPLFPWLAMLVAITLKRLLGAYVIRPWHGGSRLAPLALALALSLLGAQLTERALWWRYEMFPARQSGAQASYGELFAKLAGRGLTQLTVVDSGFVREEEKGYSPLLRWHRLVWATKGLRVTHVLSEPGATARPLASCEPAVYDHWQGAATERVGLCAVRWR